MNREKSPKGRATVSGKKSSSGRIQNKRNFHTATKVKGDGQPESDYQKKFGIKKGLDMRIYGLHACLAIFEKRKDDIIRLYVTPRNMKHATEILKHCSENKKAYHVVSDEDLEKIVASTHHEGIALVVKRKAPVSEEQFFTEIKKNHAYPIFFLDGVGNPHNLGAMMRTLAHFGIKWILGDQEALPELSASSARISEGASELVDCVKLQDPIQTLNKLKDMGWDIIGTSSHNRKNLYQWTANPKSVIVLGAEVTGVSEKIQKVCSQNLAIAGTGQVESLNVSVAAGIFAAYLTESFFS